MKHVIRKWLLAMAFLLLFSVAAKEILLERSHASVLKGDTCCQKEFRSQHLTPEIYSQLEQRAAQGEDFWELLTATMLNGDFFPKQVSADNQAFLKYKPREYALLKALYQAVWADVRCFPIPGRDAAYEDSFGAPRAYGGTRVHEGTDIFGKETAPGYYPVLSMTDGAVEKIGWLPLGGYRIGIRSPGGGYFYYAHFSEYERDFSEGQEVAAGEILGYMGNTGYGPEGTAGEFPVHLHLGIYIKIPEGKELAVNPYWVLKNAEKKIRKYTY